MLVFAPQVVVVAGALRHLAPKSKAEDEKKMIGII